jgi:phosphatidylinositol glycan class F
MPLIDPVTMSSAGAQTPAPAKPSLPIELLPTDFARIFSQAHPALLLSAYYLRFPALVADPVPTLLNSLLPLAAVQIVYAATCLPAVGSNAKPAKKTKLNASKKPNDAPTAKAFVTPPPISVMNRANIHRQSSSPSFSPSFLSPY